MEVIDYVKNNIYNKNIIKDTNWQNKIFGELITISNFIKNSTLKEVAQTILNKYSNDLCSKPATDSHHYYKGGLLWHTYCVTRNSVLFTSLYPNMDVDMDLIVFGALLHDVGKTSEMADFSESKDYNLRPSNHFELITHAAEGIIIIDKELDKYKISTDFRNQILHVIGAHMNGYSDWGDVHSARMLEPVIINFADNYDSKMEPCETESKIKSGEWFSIPWNGNKFQKSLNEENGRQI